MEGKKALKFIERLINARAILHIHGLLSDGENAKVKKRLDKWAAKHGLRRKDQP